MAVEITTFPTRQTRVFLQLFQALGSSCLVCPCFLLGLCLVVHSLDLLLHHLRVNKQDYSEPLHFDPLCSDTFFLL